MTRGHSPALLVGLLTALGLALRLIRLGFQPLWFDEGYSFYFSLKPLGELLTGTALDIHPPLYYLALKGWLALFGTGVVQARLLSVVIGAGTIVLLYRLGRRLGGEKVGLWAALLLALSPFHVYYSQEVRMYGLVTLFSVLAGLLTLRAIEEGGIGAWTAAGVALLAALYTQYYAVFVVAALTVYILGRRDRQRHIVPWLATLAGVALGYLPWLIYAVPRLVVYVQYKVGQDADQPLSPLAYLGRILGTYGAGHLEGWLASWAWLGLIPVALLVIGLFLQWRARRTSEGGAGQQPPGFAMVYALVPIVGVYIVNLLAPFNPPRSERLLLLAFPAACLLAGHVLGTARPIRSWAGKSALGAAGLVVAAIVAVSLATFYTVPRYADEDYRPVAATIGARSLGGDAVICVFPWQVGYLQAYLGHDAPALIETPAQIYPRARQFWAEDPARMAGDLDGLVSQHGRLWLPAYLASGSPLEGMMADYLDDRYLRTLTQWHGTTNLTLHIPASPTEPAEASASFAGQMRASDIRVSRGPVQSAYGSITFEADWEKLAPFEDVYHVSLSLADDRGKSWQHWDMATLLGQRPFSLWGVGERHRQRVGLLLDAGIPPGTYQLRLSLRTQTDAPLPIRDEGAAAGSEPRAEAVLVPVEVIRPATPARPAALPIGQAVEADFDQKIRLLGYSVGHGPFTPGAELDLMLFWECLETPGEPLVAFVQLLDGGGTPVALSEVPPTAGFFPAPLWQPGDLVRDEQSLRLPASLPNGSYSLIVGLFKASDRARLPVTGGARGHADYAKLEEVAVRGRPHVYSPPSPAVALSAQFDDAVRLVGYDLATARSDEEPAFRLTLHWQALREMDRSYSVFVHLYDAEGNRLAQHDSVPGLGQFPTSGWLPGEFIEDPHPIAIDAGSAQRIRSIWIGLYDPDTGLRVPMQDAAGSLTGDHLEVELDAPAAGE